MKQRSVWYNAVSLDHQAPHAPVILKNTNKGIIPNSGNNVLFQKSEEGYTFQYGIWLILKEITRFAQSFSGKRVFSIHAASGEEIGAVLLYGKRKADIRLQSESCRIEETVELSKCVLFPKREFTFNKTKFIVNQKEREIELSLGSAQCNDASVLFGCLYLAFLSDWGNFMIGDTDELD